MPKFTYLNLQQIFNHKLIAEQKIENESTTLSNLGIDGNFFKASSLPDSCQFVEIDGVPFIFPDKAADRYDNLTCEDQQVIVPAGKYSKIHFLGCCEFGEFREQIRGRFANGDTMDIDIFFNDWSKGFWQWKHESLIDCKPAFKSQITSDDELFKSIFYYVSEIRDTDNVLMSLELPFNPAMHVFSVTLESECD